MDLDVVEGSVWLRELVSMTRVTVHMSVRVWSSTVTEEMHDLVNSLLVSREVIPEHSSILQVGLRISFLCVDEERKLGRIAEEEDGSVVVDPVPVALLSVKFDRKAARVSSGIWRTLLATDSGETRNARSSLADYQNRD